MLKTSLSAIAVVTAAMLVADAHATGSDAHVGNTTTLNSISAEVDLPVLTGKSETDWLRARPAMPGITIGYSMRKLPTMRLTGTLLKNIWVDTGRVTSFAVLPPSIIVDGSSSPVGK